MAANGFVRSFMNFITSPAVQEVIIDAYDDSPVGVRKRARDQESDQSARKRQREVQYELIEESDDEEDEESEDGESDGSSIYDSDHETVLDLPDFMYSCEDHEEEEVFVPSCGDCWNRTHEVNEEEYPARYPRTLPEYWYSCSTHNALEMRCFSYNCQHCWDTTEEQSK